MFRSRATLVDDGQELVSISGASPAEILRLREVEAAGQLTCPICQRPVNLALDPQGPRVDDHSWHEPEDAVRWRNRLHLKRQMKKLFPSAEVGENEYLDEVERWPAVVVVKKDGGILALEYISEPLSSEQLGQIFSAYTSAGIQPLFLFDYRRLAIKGNRGPIVAADIRKLEVGAKRQSLPLYFFDAGDLQIAQVYLPQEISPLLEDRALSSFGRLHVALRRFSLSALRVRQGQWSVETVLTDLPPDPPPLPVGLRRRIHQRRNLGRKGP
jgi:hypothetical protein